MLRVKFEWGSHGDSYAEDVVVVLEYMYFPSSESELAEASDSP
jgi:hypothetical protein